MRQRFLISLSLYVGLYLAGYLAFRQTESHVWQSLGRISIAIPDTLPRL